MKKIKCVILSVGLALSLAPLAQAMSDADLQEKRLQLGNQQIDLLARLDRVDDVARAEAAYAAVRAQAFHAASGLAARSAVWEQGASAWLDQWLILLGKVSQVNSANASNLADQIHEQLLSQAAAYDKLRQQAQDMHSSSSIWLAQLQGVPTYPTGYIKGYEAHTEALMRRIAELRTSLAQYQSLFGDAYLQRWSILLTKTRSAIDDLLKLALMRHPELDQALDLARQALQVSDRIDPAVLRVNAAFAELNAHHLAKRPFHQDDSLQALRQAAVEGKSEIAASRLDPMFTEPALATIQSALQAAEQIASAPLPLTRNQLVASYVHRQQRFYTIKCRDPKQAALLNCELLQTLNRFDQASISTMAPPDLRLVEFAFDNIPKGPALGGI